MCIKHLIQKNVLIAILLCLVINVVCDFSVYNFNESPKSTANIDLDNTYLESFLESVFHVNIKVNNQNTSKHQASSVIFKLYSVADTKYPTIFLPFRETELKSDYVSHMTALHTQLFKEIDSPPPQA